MSPAQWGPPVWALLHTMAEKINESYFPEIATPMFQIISQICKNLPCPDCSAHATTFLNKVKMSTIQTKQDFKMMLFVFHNAVNKRKLKPISDMSGLDKYATNNLQEVFAQFVKEYSKSQGNFKLMADTSVRRRIVQSTFEWFKVNHAKFTTF